MTKKRYRKTARVSRSARRPGRCPFQDHYAAARPAGSEEHPVDLLIEAIPKIGRRRRGLIRMSDRWREQVREPRAFIAYEDARSQYFALRERLYFNAGFEYGLLAGRADLRKLSAGARAFAHEIGLAVVTAKLVQPQLAGALMDVAKAVVLGLPLRQDMGLQLGQGK